METYHVGERPVFTVEFALSGVLTTPSAFVWKLSDPDGTITTFDQASAAVATPSAGVVQFQPPAPFDKSGYWTLRVDATAGVFDAHEQTIEVLPSMFEVPSSMVERYCTRENLLVGDIPFSPNEQDRYVNEAADEMDAEIGVEYNLPLPMNLMPIHVRMKLKTCNAQLASGRLLMSRAAHGEDNSLHAYGASLVKEAKATLALIKCGQFELINATRRISPNSGNAPSIIQGDSKSAIDAFYSNTGDTMNIWRPGVR